MSFSRHFVPTLCFAIWLALAACQVIDPAPNQPPAETVRVIPQESDQPSDDESEVEAAAASTDSTAQNSAAVEEPATNMQPVDSGMAPSMQPENGMAAEAIPGMARGGEIPQIDLSGIAFESEEARRVVEILVADRDIALYLADFDVWFPNAYPDGEDPNIWYADFFGADWDEWLAWGMVDMAQGEMVESSVPRILTDEEYALGRERAEQFILSDLEVQARLGDLADWDTWIDYDPWEGVWYMEFFKGLEQVGVILRDDIDYGNMYIEEIYNPAALDEEELAQYQRDTAIELAYGSPGINEAVYAVTDEWTTYVEPQPNGRWSVSFVTTDRILFFALVDVEAEEVIEAYVPVE